ncbi:MAG: sulfurtransferase-like selenium metabolism protein YedF [Oscillospiraceae bacterium]|nr:sulfurtransferase-like selenium metabolism protein YedF [Oscillospiraceae bacterium]
MEIDCKGLLCPQPVINTKKYFDSIEKGRAVVIVDNEVAKENIMKFANGSGYECTLVELKDEYRIEIVKKDKNEAIKEDKSLTILVGTNILGRGSDELGNLLMKSYFYALTESENIPRVLIFMNSGVKLTTEGSEILDNLKKLESKGCEIISCGTCLDFYGLKDKLLIGEISNMYTIIEKMNASLNTITL